ncbi:MAG: chalcone isomerase family protein [Alphaproteobacteria bacterium]|nr:chalcone isomerase family protein [Alphaproteobacteria bacterium]
MLNKGIKWIIVMLAMLMSIEAYAANKPSELDTLFRATAPYGQGKLYKLFLHVYDAQLWTDARIWSYEQPFALSLTYYRNFSTEELVDRTFDELNRIQPYNEAQQALYRPQLEAVFPSVRRGDRITALFSPSHGIHFFFNGNEKGTISSIAFSKQFLDIWLGEKTSEPAVRTNLLKGKQ